MTVHSAKGLEFPTVFISGLEEGIFPSGRSIQDEAKLEEERRLCYVAITRAMKHLYLSYASQRMIYNQLNYNASSRFIGEIPKRLLDDEWISKREKSFPGAMDSYTHPTPRRSPRQETKGPMTFGVPKIITQGAGIGNKSAGAWHSWGTEGLYAFRCRKCCRKVPSPRCLPKAIGSCTANLAKAM